MKKDNKKVLIIIGIIVIILVAIIIGIVCFNNSDKEVSKETVKEKIKEKDISEYIIESSIVSKNTTIKDDYGNNIVIPKGFKLSKESGTNLKEGIVIEDEIGNQYVWVPIV